MGCCESKKEMTNAELKEKYENAVRFNQRTVEIYERKLEQTTWNLEHIVSYINQAQSDYVFTFTQRHDGMSTYSCSGHPRPKYVETKEDEYVPLCVVCKRGLSESLMIVPCRHAPFCADCLTKLEVKKCPICRGYINSSIKIFLN